MFKNLWKQAFEKYQGGLLTEQIAAGKEKFLTPGGIQKQATVYVQEWFSFPFLAAKLSSESAAQILSEYLAVSVDIIEEHRGEVIDLIGDQVLAFFDPDTTTDHADRAAEATQVVKERIRRLQQAMVPGMPAVSFGIDAGEVFLGNLGSARRLKFTLVGNPVNRAFRLCRSGSSYGFPVIISHDAREHLSTQWATRELDRIVVKGDLDPLAIYELIGRT